MINDIESMYTCYKILKKPGHYETTSNGKRIYVKPKYRNITAPNEELKREQKRILKEVLNNIKVSDRAFGFIQNKDIKKNAQEHLGAKWILEIDLKDFFDTITKDNVKQALINNHIEPEEAEYIATITTRYGTTPQGAPTSPMLSNIVCKPMDKKIKALATKYNCVYTRYADDITISTNDKENGYAILQEVKPQLQSIIHKYGFKINGSKTHTVGEHRSQNVTGVVINFTDNERGEVFSPRKKRENFKALLHNALKDIKAGNITTFEELNSKYKSYHELQGYANFLYQINPNQGERFLEQVKEIHSLLK